jgi:integrase
MQALRASDTVAARALEFTTLTAARSPEVREMLWCEIDFDSKEWKVPARRIKTNRQHIAPLSPRGLAILKEMRKFGTTGYVFPGRSVNRPLSDMAFSLVLDRLGYGAMTTTHGLRSTFRDWAGDETDFAREVIEFALAHGVKDESEAAYRRSTALEKRRALMNQWARYCQQKPKPNRRSAKVIPLPTTQRSDAAA